MGLDIYCRDDIANAILAAEEASSATAAAMVDVVGDPARLRAFREGYRAALATVAVAFRLAPRKGERISSRTLTETFAYLEREKL